MKLFSLLILVILSFGLVGENRHNHFEVDNWEYDVIYDYVYDHMPRRTWRYKIKTKETYASNYVTQITNVWRVYGHSPYWVCRWINVESRFRWWARSHKDAIGPIQVRVEKYWSSALHHILPPKVQRRILASSNAMAEYIRYGKTIEYGVPLGAKILDHYLKEQKLLPYALMAYNRGSREKCGGRLTVFGKAKRDIKYLYKDRYVWAILRGDDR